MKKHLNLTTRVAATAAIGALIVAGCGEDEDNASTNDANAAEQNDANVEPAADADEPSDEADGDAEPADTDDEASDDEPAEADDDEAADADAGTETAGGAENGDTEASDNPVGEVAEQSTVYVRALAAEDWQTAYDLLSDESVELLSLEGPEDLASEPWISGVVENFADAEVVVDGWDVGGGEPDRIPFTVVAMPDGAAGASNGHAFGIRQVDGEWVIDQSRADTSTGAPWADFINPTWEGVAAAGEPVSFTIDEAEDQVDLAQLNTNLLPAAVESTRSADDPGTLVSSEWVPEESGIAIATVRTVDSLMLRVHYQGFDIE